MRRQTKFLSVFFLAIFFCAASCLARPDGWKTQKIKIKAGSGREITAIHHRPDKSPSHTRKARPIKKRLSKKSIDKNTDLFGASSTSMPIYANVIDSPPINGFVPWIAVTFTKERLPELESDAIPWIDAYGQNTAYNPKSDFAVGIFDTGASSHVVGYETAYQAGLYKQAGFDEFEMLTDNTVTLAGVTGEVDAYVSQPLGVFVNGLHMLDPNSASDWLLNDTTTMAGQFNTSIMVGMDNSEYGIPDLPTAIGSPLSFFFTTIIDNGKEFSVTHRGEDYTGPGVYVLDPADERIPDYPIMIPLELRPLGAIAVQYVSLNFLELSFEPTSPSIIIGNSAQSLFFVHSVDLAEGTYSAIDKDRFMIDTGAQVTVIGSRVAARLGIDVSNPAFEVDIMGVTGDVSVMPGFYIDSIQIPALGEWLEFTDVPVILLDVASPEGGTLDGIIGMNLFNEYDMVLKGGGAFLQDDPTLSLRLTPATRIAADVFPMTGDGVVNLQDIAAIASSWMDAAIKGNEDYDIVPDGIVDHSDLLEIADNWLQTLTP